jgi:hypothetical protein
MICDIPSPKAEGQPHHAVGMIKALTGVSSGIATNNLTTIKSLPNCGHLVICDVGHHSK